MPRTPSPPQPDCYDYVRRYYRVPAFIGVRVIVGGREGVLVAARGLEHYVHIRLDGEQKSGIYHPTDGVDYVIEAFARQVVCRSRQGSVEFT